MSNESVYVVWHYGYDRYEFESLIGLAKTVEVAEHMACIHEDICGRTVRAYTQEEHARLAERGEHHIRIEMMEVKDE